MDMATLEVCILRLSMSQSASFFILCRNVILQIVYSIGPNFGRYCGRGTIKNLCRPAQFVTVSCTYAAW